jgi:hypothetical protein
MQLAGAALNSSVGPGLVAWLLIAALPSIAGGVAVVVGGSLLTVWLLAEGWLLVCCVRWAWLLIAIACRLLLLGAVSWVATTLLWGVATPLIWGVAAIPAGRGGLILEGGRDVVVGGDGGIGGGLLGGYHVAAAIGSLRGKEMGENNL